MTATTKDPKKEFRKHFKEYRDKERANYDSTCSLPDAARTGFHGLIPSRLNTRLHMFAVMIGTIRRLVNQKGYTFNHMDDLDGIFDTALRCVAEFEMNLNIRRPDHMRRLEHDLRDIRNKFEWDGDAGGLYITFQHFYYICEWVRDACFEAEEDYMDLPAWALCVVSPLEALLDPIWDLQIQIDKRSRRKK